VSLSQRVGADAIAFTEAVYTTANHDSLLTGDGHGSYRA